VVAANAVRVGDRASSSRAHMPSYVRAVLARKKLPDRAKIVFVALASLGLGPFKSVEATYVEIGRTIGQEWWTVRRAIADLVARNLLLIESIGPRFGIRFELGDELTSAADVADRSVTPFTELSTGMAGFPPPHPPSIELFENLSSVSAPREGDDRPTDSIPSEDELIADLVRRALCLARATEAKVGSAIRKWGLFAVEAAMGVAESYGAYSWGYVVKILEKIPEEGLPTARAQRPHATPPPRDFASPRRMAAVDEAISAEEIAELVSLAREGNAKGTKGWAARLFLSNGVKSGRIPAELVPAALLEPKVKSAAGQPAKVPPQPIGAPSPAVPPDYTVHTSARQIPGGTEGTAACTPDWIRTSNLRFRSPNIYLCDHPSARISHVPENHHVSEIPQPAADCPAESPSAPPLRDGPSDVLADAFSSDAPSTAVNVDRVSPKEHKR
jgi:hypothetical protein